MSYQFREAELSEKHLIWDIFKHAIARRKKDGSNQWQDGYPNLDIIKNDIENGVGFVLTDIDTIVGYTAILINDEPEYDNIEGTWLSHSDFVVFHRIALSKSYVGKGLAKIIMEHIEAYALDHKIYSIKADTNFDNIAMLKIFEKSNYTYCGQVYFRGQAREAYEKVLH